MTEAQGLDQQMDTAIRSDSLTITPLTQHVGAEVSGIALGQPLDQEMVRLLNDAFNQYVVLVFRDQDLSREQQTDFAEHFGPLGVRRNAPKDIRAPSGTGKRCRREGRWMPMMSWLLALG